jgi:RHS repeat-associated protein
LNVKSRTDSVAGVLEQFHYDSLDRLHDWQEVGSYGWGVTYSHDDIGNLTGRSLLGGKGETEALTFEHSGANAGPHAVTSSAWGTYGYNGKGNQTSSPEGTIAYTYFNLPKSIVGTDTTTLKYDASGARVSKSAGTTGTTIYAGGAYERRTVAGSKTHVFYLNASGRQIGEIVRKESDQSETVLYIHSDSLGSSEVVTDVKGQAVGERRKYDPFGAPTDITLPKAFPGESLMSTDVHIGFTGHEEDSETGLINMRGRIYNPKVGHFLTPDPFTSNPFSPVAFNPYAYVLNNPLKYSDPSGFWPSSGPPAGVDFVNYGPDSVTAKKLYPNPFAGDDEGGGGGGGINVYGPSNWSPNSPFTPGVESLGDNKGTMIMRLPGGGWMRSDDAGANAGAGGTVYVLGTDGTRMGMPLGTYLDKYEYTGDGISGQHNQQVRDNRGEISDNPSVQSIANNVNTQATPMPVGGQSAASSHGGAIFPWTHQPMILTAVPGLQYQSQQFFKNTEPRQSGESFLHFVFRLVMAFTSAPGTEMIPIGGVVKTTTHGAARIAGALATRGGVLTEEAIAAVCEGGRAMTQADSAIVHILENASGRFNVVVEGERGIITTFENLVQDSLDRLGRNYGWK